MSDESINFYFVSREELKTASGGTGIHILRPALLTICPSNDDGVHEKITYCFDPELGHMTTVCSIALPKQAFGPFADGMRRDEFRVLDEDWGTIYRLPTPHSLDDARMSEPNHTAVSELFHVLESIAKGDENSLSMPVLVTPLLSRKPTHAEMGVLSWMYGLPSVQSTAVFYQVGREHMRTHVFYTLEERDEGRLHGQRLTYEHRGADSTSMGNHDVRLVISSWQAASDSYAEQAAEDGKLASVLVNCMPSLLSGDATEYTQGDTTGDMKCILNREYILGDRNVAIELFRLLKNPRPVPRWDSPPKSHTP